MSDKIKLNELSTQSNSDFDEKLKPNQYRKLNFIYEQIGRSIHCFHYIDNFGLSEKIFGACENYKSEDTGVLFQLLYNNCINTKDSGWQNKIASKAKRERLQTNLHNYIDSEINKGNLSEDDRMLVDKNSTLNQFLGQGQAELKTPVKQIPDKKSKPESSYQHAWIIAFFAKTDPRFYEWVDLLFLLTDLIENKIASVENVLSLLKDKVKHYGDIEYQNRANYFRLLDLCYDKDSKSYLNIIQLLACEPYRFARNLAVVDQWGGLSQPAAKNYLDLVKKLIKESEAAARLASCFGLNLRRSCQIDFIRLFYKRVYSSELETYLDLMKEFYSKCPLFRDIILEQFTTGFVTYEHVKTTPAWAIAHFQPEHTVIKFLMLLKDIGLMYPKQAINCQRVLVWAAGDNKFFSELTNQAYINAVIYLLDNGLIADANVHLLANSKPKVIEHMIKMSDNKPEKFKMFSDMFESKTSLWKTYINSKRDLLPTMAWSLFNKGNLKTQAEKEYKKLKAQREKPAADDTSSSEKGMKPFD